MKNVLLFIAVLLTLVIWISVEAASIGPNCSSSGTNDSSVGDTAWANPGNITTCDDVASALTGLIIADDTSQRLVASGFGFSIPTSATINGIEVEYRRARVGVSGGTTVSDAEISLRTSSGLVGDNKADATTWSPSSNVLVTKTYGGSSDMWGTTLTPANINDAGFGVATRAFSPNGTNQARVAYIRVTVYYTDVPTIGHSQMTQTSGTQTLTGGTLIIR